jgi:hypothetical protein
VDELSDEVAGAVDVDEVVVVSLLLEQAALVRLMVTASPAARTGRRWEGARSMVIVSHKWSWEGSARHLDARFSDSQAPGHGLHGLQSCPAVPRNVAGQWIDEMNVTISDCKETPSRSSRSFLFPSSA